MASCDRPTVHGQGKSPALAAVRKLVDEIEWERRKNDDERLRAHLENVEVTKAHADKWGEDTKTALTNGNQPPPRPLGSENIEPFIPTQVIIGDTTLESVADILRGNPRGVILWRDELAAWLSNMTRYTNGSDQAAWLEAWAAAALTVNRKGKPPVHAQAALRAGGNSPHRQLDRRAALWLKGNAANRVSAEDIRRKALGQAVGAAEANNLIRRFEAMGLLRRIESPRAGPGRPAVRWEVNPALIGDQGCA